MLGLGILIFMLGFTVATLMYVVIRFEETINNTRENNPYFYLVLAMIVMIVIEAIGIGLVIKNGVIC